MEDILKKLEEAIKKPMEDMAIAVCSISYEKEKWYKVLKIVLDRVNGINMDTIVEATNVINPIVDELDLIDEEYILDISSKERGN